jgi:hypothetical protein
MTPAAIIIATLLAQASAPGQPAPQTPARATPARDQPTVVSGSAVIRGQVVDATNGSPVRRAVVRTFAPEVARNPPSTITDDEGRFELRDLPPGKYTVSASKTGWIATTFGQTRPRGPGETIELADKQAVDRVVIKMSRGGVIVGRVLDEAGEPAAQVSMSALQYRYGPSGRTLNQTGFFGFMQTDDLGAFRLYGLEPGQYYVSANPRNVMMGGPAAPPEAVGPTTTYFPNSPDPSTAQRVTVAAGRETGPIVITLVSTKLSRVRGRAIMSDGQPFAGTFVNVSLREATGGISGRPGGMTQQDGSFDIKGLPPGTYQITVRPQNTREDDDVDVARGTITVVGEDVEGLLLVGGKSGIARGHVVSDDGTPLPYSAMNVSARPFSPEERYSFSPPARVRDDGSFEIKGLFGKQLFRSGFTGPQPGGSPWMLKAVLFNGTDIIDRPTDFQPGMVVEGLELVFTQKAGEISGTVTTDRGALPAETNIVLFPADESLWAEFGRLVRVARPEKDGTYWFRMLPAHDDYLLIAAFDLEPGQYMDPDFLRSVRDRAMRLSLFDGEKKVQNIRIAGAQ